MSIAADWNAWHDPYAQADSSLSRRLGVVQAHIRDWLDETAPAPVTVLSVCAGDGRDLLHVLSGRDDAARVTATLVELDPRNVARATEFAAVHDLSGVRVRQTDAGTSGAFVGAVPADLVLLCGIFGNIGDDDVYRLIRALPQLCRAGALVVWTRHRRAPDLTPRIRSWLADAAFDELGFTAPPDVTFTVGAHRFTGRPRPLVPGQRLFSFIR